MRIDRDDPDPPNKSFFPTRWSVPNKMRWPPKSSGLDHSKHDFKHTLVGKVIVTVPLIAVLYCTLPHGIVKYQLATITSSSPWLPILPTHHNKPRTKPSSINHHPAPKSSSTTPQHPSNQPIPQPPSCAQCFFCFFFPFTPRK